MTAKYNIGELNPDSNIVDANVNSIIYPRMIIGMDMIPQGYLNGKRLISKI